MFFHYFAMLTYGVYNIFRHLLSNFFRYRWCCFPRTWGMSAVHPKRMHSYGVHLKSWKRKKYIYIYMKWLLDLSQPHLYIYKLVQIQCWFWYLGILRLHQYLYWTVGELQCVGWSGTNGQTPQLWTHPCMVSLAHWFISPGISFHMQPHYPTTPHWLLRRSLPRGTCAGYTSCIL